MHNGPYRSYAREHPCMCVWRKMHPVDSNIFHLKSQTTGVSPAPSSGSQILEPIYSKYFAPMIYGCQWWYLQSAVHVEGIYTEEISESDRQSAAGWNGWLFIFITFHLHSRAKFQKPVHEYPPSVYLPAAAIDEYNKTAKERIRVKDCDFKIADFRFIKLLFDDSFFNYLTASATIKLRLFTHCTFSSRFDRPHPPSPSPKWEERMHAILNQFVLPHQLGINSEHFIC